MFPGLTLDIAIYHTDVKNSTGKKIYLIKVK
jgi:hypothetical protein